MSIHVGRDLDDSKRRFRPLLGAEREREEKGLERRTPLQETYGFSATAKASLPPSALPTSNSQKVGLWFGFRAGCDGSPTLYIQWHTQ